MELIFQRKAENLRHELKVGFIVNMVNAEALYDSADVHNCVRRNKAVVEGKGQDLKAIVILK